MDQIAGFCELRQAAAHLVVSGVRRSGIILCGTGQGTKIAAKKVTGVHHGVCIDTFSVILTLQNNDAYMPSLGLRVEGEGLVISIVDGFLTGLF